MEALVTDVITGARVRSAAPNVNKILSDRNLQIADVGEGNSSRIELLIGSDYYWEINLGRIEHLSRNLVASETIFGWTVQGRMKESSKGNVVMRVAVEDRDTDFRKLWELDSLGINDNSNDLRSDLQFIDDFGKQLEYVGNRYKTKLIWNKNSEHLDNNFNNAKQRFNNLLRKFRSNDWLFKNYSEVIDDYLEQGIVEKCSQDLRNKGSYFMPHRAVIRNDKSTTKLRVVFDASSSERDALTLNDCLWSGPNLNPDVLSIILKFRNHNIAFSADLEKAFLQILIAEKDRSFLKFLWLKDQRDLNENNSQTLQMTRVPFGVTSSPFILPATIKHHIKKYKKENERVFHMLNESLYVDDLFHGSDSIEEACYLTKEAVKIMSDAGMNMRKWKTNSTALKENWEKTNLATDEDDKAKILGIIWNTEDDTLKLDNNFLSDNLKIIGNTKRIVLKIAAKIFDPAGFISPFMIRVKCLLQELWLSGLDWDEEFSDELKIKWVTWKSEINDIENLTIERRYFSGGASGTNLQIHTFCDATPKAYGAVAYFRFVNEGTISTSFILEKSKVAPLPMDRIVESPPFSVTGSDFAGPLFTRGSSSKYYILLCSCATTRALHLELVPDLSTDTFLLALRRFFARRGLCSIIYSGNAKTFEKKS